MPAAGLIAWTCRKPLAGLARRLKPSRSRPPSSINLNLLVFSGSARPISKQLDTSGGALRLSCDQEARMRSSMLAAALAGLLTAPVAVQAQDSNIPVMTLRAALQLPPG